MKEKFERFGNSFKTGVIVWIISYLVLALISNVLGNTLVYDAEIIKLTNPINFLMQVLISGLTYFVLEAVLLDFVDNMLKRLCKKETKNIIKLTVIYVLIIAIVCVVLYTVKEKQIISKYIMKLMMAIIVIQVIIFELMQLRNNAIFNKKLKEKNNENR